MQTQQRNLNDDVVEIDLQALFAMLFHWAWLILGCGIIFGAIAFCYANFLITPLYQSTTKVYVLNRQNESSVTYSDTQLSTQLTTDYEELMQVSDVMQAVVDELGLNISASTLASKVSVSSGTRIIYITVTDSDPEMAQILATAVREAAAAHVKEVMDVDAVNVAEEANLPTSPSSPNVKKYTLIGLLLGIFLSAAILVLRFLLDDSIRTADDVERYLGLSTLASIPIREDEQRKSKKKQTAKKSSSTSTTTRRSKDAFAIEELPADVTETPKNNTRASSTKRTSAKATVTPTSQTGAIPVSENNVDTAQLDAISKAILAESTDNAGKEA